MQTNAVPGTSYVQSDHMLAIKKAKLHCTYAHPRCNFVLRFLGGIGFKKVLFNRLHLQSVSVIVKCHI